MRLQPLDDALIDLVAHGSGKFDSFRIASLKFGWIIEGPMLMLSHVQKNGGAILFGVSTDGDGVGKDGFSQIFPYSLGRLPGQIEPALVHHFQHLRQDKPFWFQPRAMNLEMVARVRLQKCLCHLTAR